MYGGGVGEKIKCVGGGGASEIFPSPPPPEDFKWNSPKMKIAPCQFFRDMYIYISIQMLYQITSSMAPKFEKLMQAARSVRNTIQNILDDNDMYLRSQRTPLEDCCKATQLSQQANFPDVSIIFILMLPVC